MTIIYFSFWNANDGLTVSTIKPYLEALNKSTKYKRIIFVNVERLNNKVPEYLLTLDKVEYTPVISLPTDVNIFTKFFELNKIKKQLFSIIKKTQPDVLFCKGVIAGSYGYMVKKRFKKFKLYIDSFEPHAEYMAEAKVWSRKGIKYLLQNYWEKQQLKYADHIFPLTYKFQELIIKKGVEKTNTSVIPCCVNLNQFSFNKQDRIDFRKKLNLNEISKVGIYVGKFGDIYYGEEAFEIFKAIEQKIEHFFLIILTPDNIKEVEQKLKKAGIPDASFVVRFVPNPEVPLYLSASDFAISVIRPTYARQFCSPVKHAEYFANGLPLLLPESVSDDSDIVEELDAGFVFNFENLDEKIKQLNQYLITNTNNRNLNAYKIASNYRNINKGIETFGKIVLE